ncbi:MAG: peptide-methionine (S)-S-oxide reductase MsrA [bacterium]|nr:peptide-methionine (S)-S-oxide reductase MsrA [bacterium]
MKNKLAEIVFGGGCFWCTEAVFDALHGVEDVVSGYAGGHVENPSYMEVAAKQTGHAEVIKVVFDSEVIPFEKLLEIFFAFHDPTTLNRQGYDEGPEYRSIILYNSAEQKSEIDKYILELGKQFTDKKIVTEVVELDKFYPAEEYHQKFYQKNTGQPYCQINIAPKLEKLRKHYSELLKKTD